MGKWPSLKLPPLDGLEAVHLLRGVPRDLGLDDVEQPRDPLTLIIEGMRLPRSLHPPLSSSSKTCSIIRGPGYAAVVDGESFRCKATLSVSSGFRPI